MSSNERMVTDDCIILGKAVPDEISDNRFTVCTAGYSPKHGLIRIYPVPPNAVMNRWDIMEIPLEKNPKDKRQESWKVQDSRIDWKKLPEKMRVLDTLKDSDKRRLVADLLSKFGVGCVEELNERKLSLGLIKPTILGHELVPREEYDPSIQTTLDFTGLFLTRKNYPWIPKITYRDPNCKMEKPHNQQVVEWGFYEGMRKNPTKPEVIFENARIDDPLWDKTFLVGNQNRFKNSFLIISVFRFKMTGK